MLNWPRLLPLTIAACMALSTGAAAHSLSDVANQLSEDESYFQPLDREAPPFSLQDADGGAVELADYAGKVVVLNFVYTSCPDVCPLHAEKIAEVQEMINATPMKEIVEFVTITTDPVNDTADVMEGYGPAHGLDGANWTFLTSGVERPEETRELAAAFGHQFRPEDGGYQVHGVVTHIIDRDQRLIGNFHGLAFDPTNMVVFINALTNDHFKNGNHQPPSAWDKVKSFISGGN